ncbi:MAG: alpha-2-macroglobulin [Pirellulales bacterium]|nr:alpha-2-macroglobulin [Pirellulales bacterium]
MNITLNLSCLALAAGLATATFAATEAADGAASREQLQQTMKDGNYKDAYDGLRKLTLDPAADPLRVGEDLNLATQCLQRLNRVAEIDAFREAVIEVHRQNWRLLWAAAENCMDSPHYGYMIAGTFQRGPHRGGGQVVNVVGRDRIQALQLMVQAMPAARGDDDRSAVAEFFLSLSRMLLNNRGYGEAWRLQYLSDLGTLPDYLGESEYYRPMSGAPVDPDGNPIFHQVPKTFEAAETDGQRWRWCLMQAMEVDPARTNSVRMQLAEFLHNQFGVQTMAQHGWRFGAAQTDDSQQDESGTYALHTLGEDETIARLATGIKRLKLPEEFNFIKIYQQVAAEPKTGFGGEATAALAQVFENRRQYPKAAEHWRECLKQYDQNNTQWQQRREQIVGNWGRFEPIMTQPAGRGATVEYRFRNGNLIEFTAHEVNVEKLLDDVKAYLKSNPEQLDWTRMNIGNLGYRLVHENQRQYVGRQVARWKMVVNPRRDHFDKRVTVTTPLQRSGAYLLTAKMAGGNTCQIIVWLADTAIVKKPLDGKTYYYVADAVTGRPVTKAKVEFFGYRQRRTDTRKYQVSTKQFAQGADADGQVMLDAASQPPDHQWIITARTDQGRFAYLGFSRVWSGQRHDAEYEQTKVFAITDRPVYRPEQTVHYKFWVGHAKYDMADTSEFAGQTFTIEIYNPKSERIVQKSVAADAYGGLEGELALPADAPLGTYPMQVKQGARGLGGGHFRVEEYKKPEFEVTIDAPKEPVMLGEKVEATITAKYYFGSPVTEAKVKYKVLRTEHSQPWYPPGPWDWFYGPGYWWFGYDYDWYPGFRSWGCRRPIPFWWPRGQRPPEVVAEREVDIGPEGTIKIEIDTALAKAIHPDQDHKYSITAEVVDASRRTIVGAGDVLVARKPFQVYAWLDRGYYRVGDTIHSSYAARTLDGKPVLGEGAVTLLRISYADGKPVETPVQTWQLPTNEEGQAELQLTASQAGQYRLSYKLTDRKEHTLEGGYLFTVVGEGFDGSQYRFNHVELVPDKRQYAPGESVKLQINTDRVGGTVLLFARPANSVYLPPKVIRLDGKSTVEEIGVVTRDMPNFFVEAVTVADGRVHTESREIVVPPEKRVLTVEVLPSSETYKPGEKAKVRVKLADLFGEPFVGSTVVAIYDKAVEYISGGSNVPEIKAFFWKWRRHHRPQAETSLDRYCPPLVAKDQPGMGDLGVFGATVAEEMDELGRPESAVGGEPDLQFNRNAVAKAGAGPGFGGGARRGMAIMAEAPAESAAAAPMAAPPGEGLRAKGLAQDAAATGQPAMAEAVVRKEFADTALWVGALTTEKDGTAEVELEMPENLTTWRIKVWAMGHGTKVGEGATDVVTRKDLIVRLQAPRFFVQSDQVVLSAVVHNYLTTKKSVQIALELEGDVLEPLETVAAHLPPAQQGQPAPWVERVTPVEQPAVHAVEIEPGGETRVDWRVRVLDEGEAVVRMKALSDEESDAMQMTFPCYIHGMLKMEARSGALRPDETAGTMRFAVPEQRRPAQSRLEIRYSPTLAGAMVDALPYLANYPYGCTEQTLNRFLPTVITQKILIDMGLDLDEIKQKRANLNAQELGDAGQRAEQWKRYDRNPVFDQAEVRKMVAEGVTRLTEMQLSDGGWGWFSGWGERSDAHTTALVVHGLQIARQNDVALVPGVLERGVAWLQRYQSEQIERLNNALQEPKKTPWKQHADNLDALVYMVLVDAEVASPEMRDFLYRDRTSLAVYSLAAYGLALQKQAENEKLAMVMRNIGQYVQQDDENQTAWLDLPGGCWWCWYGSEFEAHAYFLKLLCRADPKGPLAPRLVKYLLNNRKHASYWNSTRDTAICIEAMADFLRASGEDKPEMTVEIWMDGQMQKAVEITPKSLFRFDDRFVLAGPEVTAGEHRIELRKRGAGPLYYNGYLTNFTLEDFITKAGLEVKVDRKYYRLRRVEATVKDAGSRGQVVDRRVEKYEREELPNLSTLASGDLCEIELEIDSKNDYEYLVFEDMKPAGFEPVDLRSGYTGNALGAYMEFRDNRVVMFVRRLARGKHSVAYRMRAEIPGQFSALPTRAWAMYAPELKANSDEIKLKIED